MRAICLSVLILASAVAPAWAQTDPMEAYMAAQERAVAQAVRPGDESLSCQAIELELTSVMNSPEMLGAQASMALSASENAAQAMSAANRMRGQAASNMAMGLASQFVPGLGMLQGLRQRGQAAQQMAQSQEQMAAMMQSMEAMAPALARAQRLSELAQARSCPSTLAPTEMAALPTE